LNKVAALQGVQVLNVNELANALKPVVLPGEEMPVTIIKEGKEQNQGVAYLDDGTMIVVEDGRRRIGDNLEVVVTSVLQTVAGKMIFAKIKGMEGEDSVSNGLDGLPAGCDLVLVHDAARPAVSQDLISRVLAGVRQFGACVPGLALTDTIKRIGDDSRVRETVDRQDLWTVQTPQGA